MKPQNVSYKPYRVWIMGQTVTIKALNAADAKYRGAKRIKAMTGAPNTVEELAREASTERVSG